MPTVAGQESKGKAEATHTRNRDIHYLRCHGIGHYACRCPNQRTKILMENGEVETEEEKECDSTSSLEEHEVNQQVLISLSIGKYEDEVLCDILPMEASHILLGRPWQFDRKVNHDGYTNKHSFEHKGKKITLVPLTPQEVYEDQLKLGKNNVSEPLNTKNHKEESESLRKIQQKAFENNHVKQSNFFVRESEIKRAFFLNQPIIVLMYKEALMSLTNLEPELPSNIVSLLQDYGDVFLEENPDGLPPIRGIEHQIDFVPGASLPNMPAYRTNPVETKELQKQVSELMEKGYIRESMSPCVVPVLLLPNKGHRSLDDHVEHLKTVLDVLRREQLFVNSKKCTFCTDNLVYLGFVVSAQDIKVDEEQVKAIREWPSPKTVGEVRSFHGLADFYQRFVKDFSTIAAPLTEDIKKEVGFKWETAQEEAFQLLKQKLTSAPLFSFPDFKKTFEIECDVSGV
ncbi:PREDICTED: uncharacterized protein LOC109129463 [Camelina sativa]|uniref:Uncharacterized protein LOC109129463 n=1 Tax=Camelina sativa TaxID=90675 RepID=A0ABM1R2M1_CAMSA|nr:PREDICTED: uncharacterized protein LOC109129463 [Camelina sativa]